MKMVCFVMLAIAFNCCVVLHAQTKDEKEVATRVELLRTALTNPDKSTLEGLVADDLSYCHSTGMLEDKAAFVNDLLSKKIVITSAVFTEQTIKITGNVAVVRHHMTGETNNNNTPAKIDIIVLMVWQKQRGQWLLLARQGAKIPLVAGS